MRFSTTIWYVQCIWARISGYSYLINDRTLLVIIGKLYDPLHDWALSVCKAFVKQKTYR
jgi:hypothetical protein